MPGRRDLGDKISHLEVCGRADVESRATAGFERHLLSHEPLPELDLAAVDTATEVCGRRLAAPLVIAPMSGGVEPGQELTRTLARTAQRHGIGLGLGSQRIALERPELAAGFVVRDLAPDILLFANLGAVNLGLGLSAEDCLRAVEMVGADALLLHLNPIQEALQGGDTAFAGLSQRIAEVCARLKTEGIPVLVREVSFGMPGGTAARLVALGAAGVDTGGRGGTSWAAVEGAGSDDPLRRRAGEVIRDWGLSTCQSLEQIVAQDLGCTVIASGGIRDGVELAKAVALGADLGGVARPFLQAYLEGGQTASDRLAEQLIFELRLAMFGCGAADLAALRQDHILRPA